MATGVKGPRRLADHLPATSADIMNEWSYSSTPIYFRGVHMDNFTVIFLIQLVITIKRT
jgi:hypothetical protein